VGVPLPETQALVLSSDNQLCGVGEAGEIVLRTPFRSLGYINASEESQKCFVKNPFRNDDSDLLYYTGDRGRYLPDGSLEILGRLDDQIKLRGVRIEPGEIQSVLKQSPYIQDALVIARMDKSREKYLVAYVVVDKERPPPDNEIRHLLRRKLPAYMIPSFIVKLNYFSLTPNGKIDTRALPEPDMSRHEEDIKFIAPRNDIERKLAEIWKRVLGIETVGIRDNFYDLGGDSFLALRAFSHIRRTFNKSFPLVVLFRSPTIEQLADAIKKEEELRSLSPLMLVLQEGGSKRPIFCIHGCLGGVLGYRPLAIHLGEEQPVYGIRAQGIYGEALPHKKHAEMVCCYAEEIQAVQPEGPYILASGGVGGWIAMEVARKLIERGQEVELLFLFDVRYHRADGQTVLAPDRYDQSDPAPEMDFVLSRRAVGWYAQRFSQYLKNIKLIRTPGLFVKRLCRNLLWKPFAYSFIPGHVKFIRDRIDYARPVMGLHSFANQKYVPKPYPGRIIYFLSRERREFFNKDWYELARGGIDIHEMPGEHVAMLGELYVHLVAEKVRYYLEEINSGYKKHEQLPEISECGAIPENFREIE
jgi:thioesterase domain-containing protein/acyl carrier protein